MSKEINILITGGAGYIGTVLVDYILSHPWVLNPSPFLSSVPHVQIKVIDNLMYKQDGMIPFCSLKYGDHFDFIYGDVRDEGLLKKHVEWADVIIPLAAIVGMPACERDKAGALSINKDHVCWLAIHKRHDAKILYPNTNSGYGLGQGSMHCTEETPLTPISTYGKTKCAAEWRVLECGGIAFRLATVFGVSHRMRLDLLVNDFTYKAVTDGYIVLFEKDFKRNYIHVRDVAKAFCHMIVNYKDYQGQVFNVGLSSANLSKWELCQKIKEQVPNFSIQVDEIRQDPDKRNYIVSNEKIEKAGWTPEVSLEDGIAELIKAYQIIPNVSKRYANV
jgi:nucleoside-diphosphate-sugar epimerase